MQKQLYGRTISYRPFILDDPDDVTNNTLTILFCHNIILPNTIATSKTTYIMSSLYNEHDNFEIAALMRQVGITLPQVYGKRTQNYTLEDIIQN